MSVVDDLVQAVKEGEVKQARRVKITHPSGYQPGVEDFGDGHAKGVVALETDNADDNAIIAGFNLDPEVWEIIGKVNCRTWQTHDERTLHYYKADLVKKNIVGRVDYEDLVKEIKAYKPKKKVYGDGDAFVVCIADPQCGKRDGDGVKGTVARWMQAIDDVEIRIKELRKNGRKLGTLYVFGMGDIIEGCAENYPQQTFTVELNLRDQIKVCRRLLVQSLKKWALLFDNVVVACVGGNHGEAVRRNGKSITDFADNHDVAIFEQAYEILRENPVYDHVKFVIPKDELAVTLDVAGEIVTITHGHLARSGSDPRKKQIEWWKNQAHGMQPHGDSKLLFTGHYHHFSVIQEGRKTHFQCPALEGGSDWWENQTGQNSPPGVLTVVVGSNTGLSGWSDLQIVGSSYDE